MIFGMDGLRGERISGRAISTAYVVSSEFFLVRIFGRILGGSNWWAIDSRTSLLLRDRHPIERPHLVRTGVFVYLFHIGCTSSGAGCHEGMLAHNVSPHRFPSRDA